MSASETPDPGQLTEESLVRSAETVARMEATLQRINEEMARSKMLVDRLGLDHPPGK